MYGGLSDHVKVLMRRWEGRPTPNTVDDEKLWGGCYACYEFSCRLYNVGEVDISVRQASCHLKATFPHFPMFSKCTDDRVVTLHTKKRASFYG